MQNSSKHDSNRKQMGRQYETELQQTGHDKDFCNSKRDITEYADKIAYACSLRCPIYARKQVPTPELFFFYVNRGLREGTHT